ncbi:helix-turn-helix domain-containing protein [Paraburkholderia fungorum]|uniref:helix-turn-helix domain-containing protein n=1 Tax=Paraburkholderia fungorum TaxID=134537 RepID=UPI0038781D81
MKTTVQYLDAVRERLNLPSDYAVSKVLGITTAAVSKYRNGHGGFDDLTAAKVAEILGVDPLEVISACYFARAKDDRTRGLWEGIWGKAVGATALATLTVCAVGLSVVPTPSQAAQNSDNGASIYIMLNYQCGKRRGNYATHQRPCICGGSGSSRPNRFTLTPLPRVQ